MGPINVFTRKHACAQRPLRNDCNRVVLSLWRLAFSWGSDRFRGPYILCDQVPGVRPGYYLLTAVGFGLGSRLLLIRTRVVASETHWHSKAELSRETDVVLSGQ